MSHDATPALLCDVYRFQAAGYFYYFRFTNYRVKSMGPSSTEQKIEVFDYLYANYRYLSELGNIGYVNIVVN